MGDIVNLKRVRKSQARDAAAAAAEANRAKHGRTKTEKLQAKAEAAQLARTLDGAKLGDDR
jgi:ribosomal protein S2